MGRSKNVLALQSRVRGWVGKGPDFRSSRVNCYPNRVRYEGLPVSAEETLHRVRGPEVLRCPPSTPIPEGPLRSPDSVPEGSSSLLRPRDLPQSDHAPSVGAPGSRYLSRATARLGEDPIHLPDDRRSRIQGGGRRLPEGRGRWNRRLRGSYQLPASGRLPFVEEGV